MKTSSLLCMAFLLCALRLPAQLMEEPQCLTQPTPTLWNGQIGGWAIPSKGNFHALVLFIQFPDDSLDVSNSAWPKDQPPQQMNTWVDSVWKPIPTPYSMSDYYNQMSLGSFHFTGKTRFVITPHTRKYYLDHSMERKDIYREIFEKLDSTMDFGEFDNWTLDSEYVHHQHFDRIVDMVVGIWRNIADDILDKNIRTAVQSSLKFTADEADLGLGVDGEHFLVDNNSTSRKIMVNTYPYSENGQWYPGGSGVTVSKGYITQGFMGIMQVTIHEVGHYLMGGMEYHVGFGSWGMVAAYGHRCFIPNSFERHRLGWMNLITVNTTGQILENAVLPDYVTSGIAYRLVADSAKARYFFLENHQRISRWDIPASLDTSERGIYVLRQDKPGGSNTGDASQMRMVPADGQHDWLVHRWEFNGCCGSQLLAVFKQLDPDRHHGWSDCDYIHFQDPLTHADNQFHDILNEGSAGQTIFYPHFAGDGKDAFRPGYNTVFSPWSNPPSDDIDRNPTGLGFEIIGSNATANGDQYILNIYPNSAVDASPAIPQALGVSPASVSPQQQLSWQANEEPDVEYYRIYRNTNPMGILTCAEPVSWTLLATINALSSSNQPVTSWVDTSPPQMETEAVCVWYRIAAVDSTEKESLKSNRILAIIPASAQNPPGNGKRGTKPFSAIDQQETQLEQNVPNPFGDQTSIIYHLGSDSYIRLVVSDALGTTVAVLAEGVKKAGTYTANFKTSNLSNGMYFYRLETGGQTISRQMIIIK